MSNLVLEIGIEEIPGSYVPGTIENMRAWGERLLARERISYGTLQCFASPRRLTLYVTDVSERQADLETELKGPPVNAAYDENGRPTRAALGFAGKQGVSVDELRKKTVNGAEYVFAVLRQEGRPVREVLVTLIPEFVQSLSFPKQMRWGSGQYRFVRPIRWLVCLLGDEVIEFEIAGVRSGRVTMGHRVLHNRPVDVPGAGQYLETLRKASVIVDPVERRELIESQMHEIVSGMDEDAQIPDDPELLTLVTNTVEFPTAFLGSFDPEYLKLPPEVLITPMRQHQQYFAVWTRQGRLCPNFIAVRDGGTQGLDLVRYGNEKVLRARLADAKFFYEKDLETPLEDYAGKLGGIVFQEKLGTMEDKSRRLRETAVRLGEVLNLDRETIRNIERSAALCKADLVTSMVYEFPELQGTMGRIYALASGENEEVATAIQEHYLPVSSGGRLPGTLVGAVVAIADKLDTIAGCFGIGLMPTGSADPYALRRSGSGIIAIARKWNFEISPAQLSNTGIKAYPPQMFDIPLDKLSDSVAEFLSTRLKAALTEEGGDYDIVDAVISVGDLAVPDAFERVKSLMKFRKDASDFDALLTAFERPANLAGKATGENINTGLLAIPEERELYERMLDCESRVSEAVSSGDYSNALRALLELKPAIDKFLDAVLVMDEDPEIRANRLGILKRIAGCFGRIADFAKIVRPGR